MMASTRSGPVELTSIGTSNPDTRTASGLNGSARPKSTPARTPRSPGVRSRMTAYPSSERAQRWAAPRPRQSTDGRYALRLSRVRRPGAPVPGVAPAQASPSARCAVAAACLALDRRPCVAAPPGPLRHAGLPYLDQAVGRPLGVQLKRRRPATCTPDHCRGRARTASRLRQTDIAIIHK